MKRFRPRPAPTSTIAIRILRRRLTRRILNAFLTIVATLSNGCTCDSTSSFEILFTLFFLIYAAARFKKKCHHANINFFFEQIGNIYAPRLFSYFYHHHQNTHKHSLLTKIEAKQTGVLLFFSPKLFQVNYIYFIIIMQKQIVLFFGALVITI